MNSRQSLLVALRTFALSTMLMTCVMDTACAQATAKQLHGHWSVVEISTELDGNKTYPFGTDPGGLFSFDPSGRYSIIIVRSQMPKFASNNRMTGTAEENRAVVQGTLAHFGVFRVNEADGTLTVVPSGSSFPNWTGIEQPARKLETSGDVLRITNPAGSAGGVALIVLRRIR